VLLVKLRFRSTECGSRQTDHVVMAKNAMGVQPWRRTSPYLLCK
jgi:hypothetical protein